MANESPVTVRTRKFLRNPLLARRQMVRSAALIAASCTQEGADARMICVVNS